MRFFKDTKAEDDKVVNLVLAEEVSFLNKEALIKALKNVGDGKKVIVDGTQSKIIDHDILEVIMDFQTNAKERNIEVEIINIDLPFKLPA